MHLLPICRCDRRPGCSRTQHKQACRAEASFNDQVNPLHKADCHQRWNTHLSSADVCVDLQVASVSRREAALAGLGALLLLPVGSAQAGLLGGPDKNEVYTADTVKLSLQHFSLHAGSLYSIIDRKTHSSTSSFLQSLLLEKVKSGLDLPKDASNREEVFQEIKEKTTAWVAKYRRGAAFQGRPSYK